MIFDISKFNSVFSNEQFFLPIRWDGKDFQKYLENLYADYFNVLCSLSQRDECKPIKETSNDSFCNDYSSGMHCDCNKIHNICNKLLKVVNEYLHGFPATAYCTFDDIMQELMRQPLKIYNKSGRPDAFEGHDPLNLFRVVNVSEDINHHITRVFHTPFTLISKVSTSRYSIAGFPSLYLGTSIELCTEEIHNNPYSNLAICSRFKLIRNTSKTDTKIDVIELGIKPQDFVEDIKNKIYYDNYYCKRTIRRNLLCDQKVKKTYLLWYPLIAACSFIRANKTDPFAPEYIIPQLLMQWIRNNYKEQNEVMGIRYFSCSSERTSELGFNYVFPTSGNPIADNTPYCKVLSKVFQLTKPVFLHEFNSLNECQSFLKNDKVLYSII